MKIVFVNPTGILGGAEFCLLDVLAAFRLARPSWSLRVLLGEDGPLAPAVEALDVPCDVFPLPELLGSLGDASLGFGRRITTLLTIALITPAIAILSIFYVAMLSRSIRADTPDLVQTNGMKAHLLGTLAAPRGVPVIWHLHDFLGSRRIMAWLLRLVAFRGVHVVAVSHAVANDAAHVLGPRVPVVPIYNTVDLTRYCPGPSFGTWLDTKAGFPLAPEGTLRVGLMATYARWKGQDVFLEALARLAPDLSARFFLIGGPLYRSSGSQFTLEELRAKAQSLGLTTRVGFVEHQACPEAVYQGLDIVVHASTRPEPFGRVIVEAMACGCAVIASATGGATELFDDGITAVGCPPGDPEALSKALTRLIQDAELRHTLAAAGRAAAVARFDRAGLAQEWLCVYENAGCQVDR